MRIAVVGSGPSALATVSQLLESNLRFKIKVLDVGDVLDSNEPIGFKSYFGSTNMYDRNSSKLTHLGIKPVVWPSSGLGGFSRIWGAAIGMNPTTNFQKSIKTSGPGWESNFTTLGTKKLLKKYSQTKRHKWELLDHNLAVDPEKCVMCGDCLTGCPTDAIWFAGNEWRNIQGIEVQTNFRVTSIKPVDGAIEVYSSTGENLIMDWVFLAAGAIASSQILMRSELIPKTIEIKDTKTIFFPALRFPMKENAPSFSLSQLSARFTNKFGDKFYLQLYPDSRKISESISIHKPKIGKIIKRFWKALSPLMITGVIYIDQTKSPNLQLTMNDNNSFELRQSPKKIKRNKFFKDQNFSKSLFKEFGIIPLFMLSKKAEPGESYHFGSINEIVDLNEKTKDIRVNVVDSSALKHLLPGPITNEVMDNAKLIVKQFLECNYEILD